MVAPLKNPYLVLLGLATLLANSAAAGDSQAQQKKQPPAKSDQAAKKAANNALKATQAEVLKEAYILLAAADYDYGGHRGKAVNSVKAAANLLNPNAFKDGTVEQRVKDHKGRTAELAKAMNWEGRLFHDRHHFTDYQLAQAGTMLTDVANVLAANKKPEELKHVQSALQSIGVALNVEAPKRTQKALKGKEAQALMEVYILLAASEFKYGGHRAKAMDHIRGAAKSLDANTANMLNSALVQQKIAALQENNATLAAMWSMNGDEKRVRRYLSDAQLFEAGVIGSILANGLAVDERAGALMRVQEALKEIGVALVSP
jgi:hypothetical protein